MNDVLSLSIRDFYLILILVIEWLSLCEKKNQTKVCRRIEVNHFDEHYYKKDWHHIRSKPYVLLILIEYENKLGSVSYTLQEISLFFKRTMPPFTLQNILKEYTSLTWQYSTYELMGGDTLTWFQLYWDIECYI